MQYLGTNEIGFDPKSLGFPSVKTCMAIVYGSNAGLFGLHDAFGNLTQLTAKAGLLATFVQSKAFNHAALKNFLISVIVKNERWDPDDDNRWRDELVAVAARLHYDGPIWGARITGHMEADQGHAAYIRVDVGGAFEPRCKVRYKRQSKMEVHGDVIPASAERRYIAKDPATQQYETRDPEEDIKKLRRIGKLDEGHLVSLPLHKLR